MNGSRVQFTSDAEKSKEFWVVVSHGIFSYEQRDRDNPDIGLMNEARPCGL